MSQPTARDLEEVYPNRHDLHKWSKGDRGYSHYTYKWHTVTTDPDDSGWFGTVTDDGEVFQLNAERLVVEKLAIRFGYGGDPKSTSGVGFPD